jgi:hypothetical protein
MLFPGYLINFVFLFPLILNAVEGYSLPEDAPFDFKLDLSIGV